MSEQPKQLSQEVYKLELEYLRSEQKRTEALRELVDRFEEPSDDLVTALRSMRSSANKGFVLDPEKFKKLKEGKPELYNRILPVYMDFLKEKGGF